MLGVKIRRFCLSLSLFLLVVVIFSYNSDNVSAVFCMPWQCYSSHWDECYNAGDLCCWQDFVPDRFYCNGWNDWIHCTQYLHAPCERRGDYYCSNNDGIWKWRYGDKCISGSDNGVVCANNQCGHYLQRKCYDAGNLCCNEDYPNIDQLLCSYDFIQADAGWRTCRSSSDYCKVASGYFGGPYTCLFENGRYVWKRTPLSECNPCLNLVDSSPCNCNEECESNNCVNGKCCTSHSYKQCYNNDVYWYNSCTDREEKYDDCDHKDIWVCGLGNVKKLKNYYCSNIDSTTAECKYTYSNEYDCDNDDRWVCVADTKKFKNYYCSSGICTFQYQNEYDCNNENHYSNFFESYCSWNELRKHIKYFDYTCSNGNCEYDHWEWRGDQLVEKCDYKCVEDSPGALCEDYCDSDRCGDGTCNCGETKSSCPQDCEECNSGPCCDISQRKFKPSGSQPTGYTDDTDGLCSGSPGSETTCSNSPTGTCYVLTKDYYCNGNDTNAHVSYTNRDTCGTCEYCSDNDLTCNYYTSSTSCGSHKECDGHGSCLDVGYCGNGICGAGEDAQNCPQDCGDHCSNGILDWDQDETDVDCGLGCDPCPDGKRCMFGYDCQSGYCNPNRVCSMPTCNDGWKNGNEWGIDCGGFCPEDCETSWLEKYSPVLYMHPNEKHFPTTIQAMLENSKLQYLYSVNIILPSGPVISDVKQPVYESDLVEYNGELYFLNLNSAGCHIPGCVAVIPTGGEEFQLLGLKSLPPSDLSVFEKYPKNVYGRVKVDSGSIILQYWFFYIFNEGANNHEGDWEMIQVILNKYSENPEKVTYAYHFLGKTYSWSEVGKVDTHPIVYVSKGSHASYKNDKPEPIHPFCIGYINIQSDKVSSSGKVLYFSNTDVSDIANEKETYILTEMPGKAKWEDSWINFKGRWGEVQIGVGNSLTEWVFGGSGNGPKSPTNQGKKWDNPLEWSRNPKTESLVSSVVCSPADLHVYDSEGRHNGPIGNGSIEMQIPETYLYEQSNNGPDLMIILKDDVNYFIKATDEGKFDFLLENYNKSTSNEIYLNYNNIPITNKSSANLDFAQNNYNLSLDYDGDNITDFEISPYNYSIKFDFDSDGIPNKDDNCPNDYNPLQKDSDGDEIGDVCDVIWLTGDINYDYNVNIFDLAGVGLAFGSSQGDGNYNPDADINWDGRINIFDLVPVGLNYGRNLVTCNKESLCSSESYCEFENTGTGICKPLPNDCVCIALYSPVCGSDGKTYPNDCVLNCLNIAKACDRECPCITNCITETFNTTSYMDSSTTADWDTSDGKLKIVYTDSPMGSREDSAHIIGAQPSGMEFYQGNSFMLPDDFVLKSVNFKIYAFMNNNIPSGLWVQIRTDDGTGLPSNIVLAEKLNHYTTRGWKTVSLLSVLLHKNTRYHLVLITDNQRRGGHESAGIGYWWNDNHESLFDLGYQVSYKYDGDYWYKIVGKNFVFYLNGDYKGEGISKKINSGETIRSATLDVSGQKPGSSSISYYLSADGAHWESVSSGVEHTFTNPGTDLRWKAVLETSDIAKKPEVDSLIICYSGG